MAKTACEEAADFICDDYGIVGISNRKRMIAGPEERNALSNRLRSEARELKRLRGLVTRLNDEQFKYKFAERVPLFMSVRREAARIQKARKK